MHPRAAAPPHVAFPSPSSSPAYHTGLARGWGGATACHAAWQSVAQVPTDAVLFAFSRQRLGNGRFPPFLRTLGNNWGTIRPLPDGQLAHRFTSSHYLNLKSDLAV